MPHLFGTPLAGCSRGSFRRAMMPFLSILCAVSSAVGRVQAQPVASSVTGDSVFVRIVDTDLRSAVTLLSKYLGKPTVIPQLSQNPRVTMEAPAAVPVTAVKGLVEALLKSHGFELTADSSLGVFRVVESVRPRPPQIGPPAFGPPTAATQRLWVVPVRYARASRVAQIINSLLGRASAVGEIGDAGSTLAGSLRDQSIPPQRPGDPAIGRPMEMPTQLGSGQLAAGTVIVADDGTNVLLVRGSEADREQVAAAVRSLDVRPLQVLIEVLIAEVRRDRSTALGLELVVPEQPVSGARGVVASGSQTGAGLGDLVVRVMSNGSFGATAVLRAAQSRGDAKIVSRPVIIAVNNEQAEILVGSQRPFVQVQRSLPTDAPARDQVVQYRDVGTRLSVRPTISADGYIALQITQEVNAATSETQFDAPIISTRNLQTRLIVRDSQTIVLGGLTDVQRENSRAGTPLLSRIPLIGALFGRGSSRTAETEFFLFLTPRILRDDAAVESATRPRLKESPR